MKTVLYQLLKWLGVFWLARRLTRDQARILCYHGFSYRDEHLFSAPLFMRTEVFAERLALIERMGFAVISLDELSTRLHQKQSLRNTLIFTVDDGWTGFAEMAWPLLAAKQWPCTLYLTTWCMQHRLPVLNVLRRYLQWKGISLPNLDADDQIAWQQIQGVAQAGDLTTSNGQALFHLISLEQTENLVKQGLDIQLHTHRHRVPEQDNLLIKELEDNRQFLEQAPSIRSENLNHFCYPSGEYRPVQFATLARAQIKTATTTELGLVRSNSHPYALPRLLDADNISALEFEAELSGFKSLVRRYLKTRSSPSHEAYP